MVLIHPKGGFWLRLFQAVRRHLVSDEGLQPCYKKSCPYWGDGKCHMWGDGWCSVHPERFEVADETEAGEDEAAE